MIDIMTPEERAIADLDASPTAASIMNHLWDETFELHVEITEVRGAPYYSASLRNDEGQRLGLVKGPALEDVLKRLAANLHRYFTPKENDNVSN